MKYFLTLLIAGLLATPLSLPAQNSLLVLNKSGDTAWQLDAATGEKIAEYPTGTAPHEVAVSPDKKWAVITNYGEQQSPGNSLTVINLEDRSVAKTINLGKFMRPHGIEWFSDNRRVVVSAEQQQAVVVVDVINGKVEHSIKTNESISHMVELGPDEKRVFVTNIGSGSLTVLDLQAQKSIKTIPTGEGAEGLTLANGGNELWVTNRASDTISIIDTNTLQIVDTLKSSSFPIRAEVSPDGQFVAVSNARSSTVIIYNAKTKEELHTISTQTPGVENGIPIGLTFSNDSTRLFIANSNANHIVVIEVAKGKVMETFETGETPDGIAFIGGK